MDKILIPLLVVAASSSVWCNSTRTAKLEILRSPTKVAVWKPDPYPILRSYGDELPAPPFRNRTTLKSNVTEDNEMNIKSETVDESMTNSTAVPDTTEVNNSTKDESLDSPVAKNDTCVRRDYEEEVAAVFREEAGPIESALLVFNTTVQNLEEKIFNVTDLVNLRVLNETTVACGTYLKLNETLGSADSTDLMT